MYPRSLMLCLVIISLLLTACPVVQKPEVPRILFPADGASYEEGNLVSCTASLEVLWESSIDGVLGNGASISVVLSPGLHTVSAVGADGAVCSISVLVRAAVYTVGEWKMLRSNAASASCVLAPGAYKVFAVGGSSACTVSVEMAEYQKQRSEKKLIPVGASRLAMPVFSTPARLFVSAKKMTTRATRGTKTGDTRQFRVANPEYGTGTPGWTVDAECVYTDATISIWKDTAYSVDPDILADYIDKLHGIVLPRVQALWGEREEPDSDGKLALLMTGKLNEQELAVGFFNPCDFFPYNGNPSSAEYNPTSNEMDILYMGIPVADSDRNFNRYSLLATAAHEYQHLVRFSRKTWIRLINGDQNPPLETLSFDEGMSHLTESLVGYGVSGGNVSFAAYYLGKTGDISLCGLDRNGADDSAGKRGMAALLLYYLFIKKGGAVHSASDPSIIEDKGGLAFIRKSIDYYGTGWDYVQECFGKDMQTLLADFGKSIIEDNGVPNNCIDSFTGEPVNLDPFMGSLTSLHDPSLTFTLVGPARTTMADTVALVSTSLSFFDTWFLSDKTKFRINRITGNAQTLWGFFMGH